MAHPRRDGAAGARCWRGCRCWPRWCRSHSWPRTWRFVPLGRNRRGCVLVGMAIAGPLWSRGADRRGPRGVLLVTGIPGAWPGSRTALPAGWYRLMPLVTLSRCARAAGDADAARSLAPRSPGSGAADGVRGGCDGAGVAVHGRADARGNGCQRGQPTAGCLARGAMSAPSSGGTRSDNRRAPPGRRRGTTTDGASAAVAPVSVAADPLLRPVGDGVQRHLSRHRGVRGRAR